MVTIANKYLKSSYLLITSKVLQRTIGLVSIMILARILTPDDFAIVALTSIIIYFFDMLSNVGAEQYIIQKKHVTTNDLNTAWTIDLISKCSLWLLLISGASFVADYFEKPQLQSAIYVMSLLLPLNALKNPGSYLLKSELNYQKIFWLTIVQKLTSFIVVITIALLSPSFWALIIADLVASLIFLIGSYKIHDFRPRVSLINSNEQWLFSKYLLLKGMIGYARSQIDILLVSKLFSPLLGQYYMARNIAMLPSHNIISPALEPLLAVFKTKRDQPKELARQVNITLFIVTIITIPIVMFIYNFPQLIVGTLLGDKWINSDELMSYFALLLLYFPYILVFETILIIKNKIRVSFIYDVASLLLIVTCFATITLNTPTDIAFYRGLMGCISTLILILYIKRIIPINFSLMILTIGICLATSILSVYISDLIISGLNINTPIKLLCAGFFYIITYIILLMFIIRMFRTQHIEINITYSLIENKWKAFLNE